MPKQIQDAYIVAATRSPIGKAPRGTFKHLRPDDLLVQILQSTLNQVPKLDPSLIEDVIVGCAFPEGAQGLNIARTSILLANLPNTIAGVTINRYCASGLTAIAMAADRIRVGEADVMIAAGIESMSQIPMLGYHPSINPDVFKDEHIGIAYGMGLTAEKVANQWKISRQAQDEFALSSHQKALKAQETGEFNAEITPIQFTEHHPNLHTQQIVSNERRLIKDEGVRADSTIEALNKLKPVFSARGSVTAGNSSQTSDGAGALILVSEKILKQHNLTPLARFSTFAVAGVPPEIMGIGPKFAIPKACAQANIHQNDIDWFELNEAFAAQSLAVIQDLNLNINKVNPLGGAIALGHPLGATGAMRSATVVHALQRHQLKYGMVTMCIGTGMGAAGIFERV
jgi:acetyl-CoA acyltransferase